MQPTLSAQLIRLFHDPATNPAGVQLVCTSHDTSLLNHLNRDEVWLMAASARCRDVDRTEVLRALGLIG